MYVFEGRNDKGEQYRPGMVNTLLMGISIYACYHSLITQFPGQVCSMVFFAVCFTIFAIILQTKQAPLDKRHSKAVKNHLQL